MSLERDIARAARGAAGGTAHRAAGMAEDPPARAATCSPAAAHPQRKEGTEANENRPAGGLFSIEAVPGSYGLIKICHMIDITDFLQARIDSSLTQARQADTAKWMEHASGGGIAERAEGDAQAKENLIALHQPEGEESEPPRCKTCVDYEATSSDGWPVGPLYPCETLRALASPYASHPDFQSEWVFHST